MAEQAHLDAGAAAFIEDRKILRASHRAASPFTGIAPNCGSSSCDSITECRGKVLLLEGIYELRVRYRAENYRMLYFFHGSAAVVLTHGFTKERIVPRREIHRALDLKRNFEMDPESHTHYWEPTE
ncbi:MAG: type II toxin-antitoxin system RelE/ParE family toxin [Pseudomonadota bacterium]